MILVKPRTLLIQPIKCQVLFRSTLQVKRKIDKKKRLLALFVFSVSANVQVHALSGFRYSKMNYFYTDVNTRLALQDIFVGIHVESYEGKPSSFLSNSFSYAKRKRKKEKKKETVKDKVV